MSSSASLRNAMGMARGNKLLESCKTTNPNRLAECASGFWCDSTKQGVFLVFFTCMVALPLLLTTLAPYDDEGYVMMTLKSFSENHPLYEETFTQYGPAYYLLTEPLHSLLGLPLTQHAIRLKTAVLWIIPVLLTMGIMLRLSGNRTLALTTSCMVAIHLGRLALEPGHPQEISLLMSMLGLWLLSDSSPRRWWMAGCCAALCGLCKLNVGFVLTISVLLAACMALPEIKYVRRTIFFAVWALGSLAVGATMLRLNLGRFGIVCPIVLLVAWLAVVVLASQKSRSHHLGLADRRIETKNSVSKRRSFRPLLGTLTAGWIATFLVALWALINGTSLSMLAWGVVGQHSAFAKYFFQPIPLDVFAVLCGLLVVVSYRNRQSVGIAGLVCFSIAILKTAGIASLPLNYNCQTGAEWLAVIGPCFAPALLLFRRRMMRGRVMLAGMTVLGPWIAFPVPGTQLMLGTLPAWLTLGVVASDGLRCIAIAMQSNIDNQVSKSPCGPFRASFSMLLLAGSCAIGLASSIASGTRWVCGSSLGFRGSEWIHLDPQNTQLERQIAQEIVNTGASHLVFDGHANNRFFFWTGLKPLTHANATIWPCMFSSKELAELRASLDQNRSLCVVIPPDVPPPSPGATGEISDTRNSLYDSTVFDFRHPSGWSIGIREGMR